MLDKSISCHACVRQDTHNLPINIVDFRGFDSSTILKLRGGIPRPMGDLPESLSQAILEGIMLVGRLGVLVRFVQAHGELQNPALKL